MRAAAAGSLLATLVLSVAAEAHLSRQVRRVEAQLFGDRMVIFLRYELSEPRFCSDLRERFDQDGDRTLSGAEQESAVAYLQAEATRDLHVALDGRVLEPASALRASSGLDRPLPSSFPIVLRWQLDCPFPEGALREGNVHLLDLKDTEARWNSKFSWTLLPAPGIHYADSRADGGAKISPRNLEFPEGRGSFRIPILFQDPTRYRDRQ